MNRPVPAAGYVAALAGFPKMGPRRLRRLLAHHPPEEAYAVAVGRARPHLGVERMLTAELLGLWAAQAAGSGPAPADCWARCERSGVRVVVYGDPEYPAVLDHDPLPPAALFVRGDLDVLGERRAGVIGTRNATGNGLEIAQALGAGLANAGVAVVSGLARGVDGAAHRGALEASGRPIAVVGNGPDEPYPRSHRTMWAEVCDRGLLLSEWPPGVGPDAFRFPMRNRILAALCEVLVVVESRERGGSLVTVREALDRSVAVMAVPGSPRSRAAAGTNALIGDGAAPVTCTDDVLVALGLDTRRRGGSAFDPRPLPSRAEAEVLELCRTDPRTLDEVVRMLSIPVPEAAMALARLERSGWLAEAGGWFEAVGGWPSRDTSGGASWPGAS